MQERLEPVQAVPPQHASPGPPQPPHEPLVQTPGSDAPHEAPGDTHLPPRQQTPLVQVVPGQQSSLGPRQDGPVSGVTPGPPSVTGATGASVEDPPAPDLFPAAPPV